MQLKTVFDDSFKRYGRVLHDLDFTPLLKALEQTPCPDDVEYIASYELLENTESARQIRMRYFGGMQVDIGYCNGHNWSLNALEYHKNSELNIAATDAVILLGDLRDIDDDLSYDTALVEAFYLPANTAVELYATTLHYAPCSYGDQGFRVGIVLPKGTNSELTEKPEDGIDSRLLFATNKWLMAHEEAGIAGAYIGLKGETFICQSKIGKEICSE